MAQRIREYGLRPRCEAVIDTGDKDTWGKRCPHYAHNASTPELAELEHAGGRPVLCWVHGKAWTNPVRDRPLELVA